MADTITKGVIAKVKSAKTLHDLVRKPYKGIQPDPEMTITDRVALLLMGSDGLSARAVERQLGISTHQFDHALFSLDENAYIRVHRKQGTPGHTQLYYI